MMKKIFNHIAGKALFLLVLSGLVVISSCSKDSCSRVEVLQYQGDGEDLCELLIGTKGGSLMSSAPGDYRDTTYRVQLFYRGSDANNFPRLDSLITPYSGTYCKPKGTNTWLTPCAVDADYAYDSTAASPEDSRYGLRAGRYHNYYLFVNSPATEYVKYDSLLKTNPGKPTEQVMMRYYGLPYYRGGDAKDHPSVSPAANVTTIGLTTGTTTQYGTASSTSYIYSLDPGMELLEYRSRIAFSVRCGDAITHANFKKLEISGLRRYAVFRPFSKDFLFEDIPANYENIQVYESPNAMGIRLTRLGSAPDYTPGLSQSLTGPSTNQHLDDTRTNEYFSYILSDDYKSTDKDNRYINTPANLQLYLVSDEGNPISLDPVPLSFVFEPQKSYFFLITVNSTKLEVEVTARAWDERVNDATIDDPVLYSVSFNISDWTTKINTAQIDPGTGGDDAPRYDKSTGGVLPGDWNTTSGGSGTIDEIKLVDLGLPSGVKWGSCNLGDTWPEEDGLHAAFGADTCNTWMGTKWSVLGFTRVPECEVDANNNLLPEYDAVRTWLPSPWRMPTKAEFEELLDPANCSQSWTSDYNGTGVAGMVFTSVRNSRSIFFPACGYGANAARTNAGTGGYYWSSTKDSDTNAWSLSFTSSAASVTSTARNYGLNIRPVQ